MSNRRRKARARRRRALATTVSPASPAVQEWIPAPGNEPLQAAAEALDSAGLLTAARGLTSIALPSRIPITLPRRHGRSWAARVGRC